MKRIVFFGDSVTDAVRPRDIDAYLGSGYATVVASALSCRYPLQYEFLNRGIGGNRVVDLYARIKSDLINLAPDYVSILVGVNDVWHELERQDGVAADKFEKIYGMMTQEIRAALPTARLLLLEPFVVRGSATEDTAEQPQRYSVFRREVALRGAATRRVADREGCLFVPLQELFDRQCAAAEDSSGFWTRDGVHPTAAGHGLIAGEWLKAFDTIR